MNIPSPSPAVLRGVDGNIHTNWLLESYNGEHTLHQHANTGTVAEHTRRGSSWLWGLCAYFSLVCSVFLIPILILILNSDIHKVGHPPAALIALSRLPIGLLALPLIALGRMLARRSGLWMPPLDAAA